MLKTFTGINYNCLHAFSLAICTLTVKMLYDVWQTENAESPRAAGGGGHFGYWMRKGERKRGRKEKQGTPLKYKAECELSSTSVISRWAKVVQKS